MASSTRISTSFRSTAFHQDQRMLPTRNSESKRTILLKTDKVVSTWGVRRQVRVWSSRKAILHRRSRSTQTNITNKLQLKPWDSTPNLARWLVKFNLWQAVCILDHVVKARNSTWLESNPPCQMVSYISTTRLHTNPKPIVVRTKIVSSSSRATPTTSSTQTTASNTRISRSRKACKSSRDIMQASNSARKYKGLLT